MTEQWLQGPAQQLLASFLVCEPKRVSIKVILIGALTDYGTTVTRSRGGGTGRRGRQLML